MEKLADSGMLAGVIDVTTTEVCDHLFGGVLSAGPDRLGAIARSGIPYVGSCGALDMVNFWAPETVPDRYAEPPLLPPQRQHHADADDAGGVPADRRLDRGAAQRLRGPVRFLIPEKGVSALDIAGGAFDDPAADAALFDALQAGLDVSPDRQLDPPAAAHQRPGLRRRAGRGLSRDRSRRRLVMPAIARADILTKFRRMVADGQPIIGGGAGTGLSAKCEEAGGIDLIVIYNSGRYRMAGRGSAAGLLAFGNANEIVQEMAVEVLPVVSHTPVLAGVNGTDPFVLMGPFLAELKAMGFSGVQNFPTIGLFDGAMRTSFEETGMGFGLEVDMIAAAHALDLLTTPYVFNAGRGGGDDPRRRRRDRRAHGRDHRRLDRRHLGEVARQLRRRDRRDRRRGARRALRRDRALPRRADRDARGRRLCPEARPRLPRLLWRLQHGAPAGGAGAHRTDPRLQGDPARAEESYARQVHRPQRRRPRDPRLGRASLAVEPAVDRRRGSSPSST